jgi:hypothetical protein
MPQPTTLPHAPQIPQQIFCYSFILLFPVYKTEINGSGNSLRWPRNTLYQQRLALTSPTSGGRSVGVVRLRTTATEFSLFWSYYLYNISRPPLQAGSGVCAFEQLQIFSGLCFFNILQASLKLLHGSVQIFKTREFVRKLATYSVYLNNRQDAVQFVARFCLSWTHHKISIRWSSVLFVLNTS